MFRKNIFKGKKNLLALKKIGQKPQKIFLFLKRQKKKRKTK